METNVDKQSFIVWKSDPTTKAIFYALEELRRSINVSLTDANIITNERDQLVRLLGQREGLDVLLNIEATDVVDEEIEDED